MKKIVMIIILSLCLVLPLNACSSSREKELEDQLAAFSSRLDAIEGVSPSPSDSLLDSPTLSPSSLLTPTPLPYSKSQRHNLFQKTVAMSGNHILIIKNDGSLWGMYTYTDGSHSQRFLTEDYPDTIGQFVKIMDRCKSVACSFCSSCAIDEDNNLWVWGDYPTPSFPERARSEGFDVSYFPNWTPKVILEDVRQAVTDGHGLLAVKNDNTLWAWGSNILSDWNSLLLPNSESFQYTPTMVMDQVQAVSLGGSHTLVLKTDGSLWGCGHNNYGQLGNGTTTDAKTPVWIMDKVQYMSAGSNYSLVVDQNDTLLSFGLNYSAQLGDGGAGRIIWLTKDQEAFKQYSKAEPYSVMNDIQIASAMCDDTYGMGQTSYAVKNDKTLWAWGAKTAGAIGDGIAVDRDTTDIQAEPLQIMNGVIDAFSCNNNGFALKEDGSLWLWGRLTSRIFDLEDGESASLSRKLTDDVRLLA